MIRAIAIDDEPLALELIEQFSSKVEFLSLEKTFTQPSAALKYLSKFPIDLIFLDIKMPSISGIELFNELPENIMVIFTTAHSEYAVEGYNLNAVDYLLKPFEEERFLKAVSKANEYYSFLNNKDNITEKYLFIRADYKLIKIPLSEITFIEGLGDYIKVNYAKDKLVVARMTMKAILSKLPNQEFIRVHRSFIIPYSKIDNVRNKNIQISDHIIPIGTSYEDDFYAIYKG